MFVQVGAPCSGWPLWGRITRVVLAIGLSGGALPALGQSDTLFDETRVMRSSHSACFDETSCSTFKGGLQTIEGRQSKVLTFQCPDKAPYFTGWDAEQNEHIQATMLPQPLLDNGDVPNGRNIKLILLVENVGTGPGNIAVSLGCSTEAVLPTRMRHQTSGIPSNRATFGGN